MHFRVRKNVVQLIRITYDADKKRGVNTVVGAVPLAKPELPPDLHAMLSVDERAAFAEWVQVHWHTRQMKQELAALTLGDALAQATGWFEQHADTPTARAIAFDVSQQMQLLRRTLRDKGLTD